MDLIPFEPSTLLGGHRCPYYCVHALCPIDRLRCRLLCAAMISVWSICAQFTPPRTIPKWAWPSAQEHQDILPKQESGLGFTPPARFRESRVTKGVAFLQAIIHSFFSSIFVCNIFAPVQQKQFDPNIQPETTVLPPATIVASG